MINLNELRECKKFEGINDSTLNKLCEIGKKVHFKKGQHVFRDKEYIDNVYIVESGKVSLYKLNEAAHKKIIFILGEGHILNEVILERIKSSISCEMFDEGYIYVFDRNNFIKVMSEDFELTKKVINSLSSKVRRLYRQMKNSTPLKIEKRLAAKLWKLSKDYGVECGGETLINLKISITYLSDMFGMPRETISRAIKILEKEGLIRRENKKVIVIDREELSNYFKGL
ncbi:Crp/Fnr family transcriptional regulator [Clostridium sp. Ade.TY]|uniref:Crp/Fnr family transcriptional regulator n=1 Tax=Clostridium sp. Ade.TY TaxID=1391647 RepID=UPI000407EE17|nr:Crp/Fnr family transcriptional regulator [Clostridium sp. Ade.TY]